MPLTVIKSPNRDHMLVGPGYVKRMTSATTINLLRTHLNVGLADRLTDSEYDAILEAVTDPRALVQTDRDRFDHEKSYAQIETTRRILIDTHTTSA